MTGCFVANRPNQQMKVMKPRCWNGENQNLLRNCSATTSASANKMERIGKFCRQSCGLQTAARSTGREIALPKRQILPLFPDIYCAFQTNSFLICDLLWGLFRSRRAGEESLRSSMLPRGSQQPSVVICAESHRLFNPVQTGGRADS